FGLKDSDSYLKCVAFKSSADRLKIKPEEGREIIARGRIGLWPTGGTYQLYVDSIEDVGKGALWIKFEETRKKLQEEGLFDEEIKRPLPIFPRRIGIVTSRSGAALRDMLRIFNDRAPYMQCIVSPSLVQGETAQESLIAAIDLLEMWDSMEIENGNPGLDLIIIGRGGGSFEDLACFNDEKLVRRVRETRIPVISAVGHEIDFTIIDFVADIRAATPTQAANIAAPSASDLKLAILSLIGEFRQTAEIKIETYRTGILNILSRPVFSRPLDKINIRRQNLDMLSSRMSRALNNRMKTLRHVIASVQNRLEALNPTAILSRGYSLAFERDSGKLLMRVNQANLGMGVDLRVSDGIIPMRVEESEPRQ
ncbi:MAG TPA: exodeoxyribonuclease VII large subunit, partial [Firmicutes bacterium]|nr:exodeoxyribonuclease VII large subunit [Bacillota bacterium]